MLSKIILLVVSLCLVQAAFIKNDTGDNRSGYNDPAAFNKASIDNVIAQNGELSTYYTIGQIASDGAAARAVCFHWTCMSLCTSRGFAWGLCVGLNTCRCYR